jgi:hypothetical protein
MPVFLRPERLALARNVAIRRFMFALPLAGGLAVSDGPLPFGDFAGVVLTITIVSEGVWQVLVLSDAGQRSDEAVSADVGADGEEGCIYCVSGDKTSSGKDYVGSTDNMGNRKRDRSDGRDREGAEVVDTYPKGDRDARRAKEQQAMNDRGGVDKLDNKRNEVAPKKWPSMRVTPP